MMNRRSIVLLVLFALLIVVYVVFFTGRAEKEITVIYELVKPRRFHPSQPLMAVRFMTPRNYAFDLIEVEEVDAPAEAPAEVENEASPDEGENDGLAFVLTPEEMGEEEGPMWRLIVDDEADRPVSSAGFWYGQRIRGMKRDPNRRARLLKPGQTYRLTVEADGVRGQLDFQTRYFQEPQVRPR